MQKKRVSCVIASKEKTKKTKNLNQDGILSKIYYSYFKEDKLFYLKNRRAIE